MKAPLPFLLLFVLVASAAGNLLANGGFEDGLSGWSSSGWSRNGSAAISVALVNSPVHSGAHAARVVHTGTADWSFETTVPVNCTPGDVFSLTAYFVVAGEGTVQVCAVGYDNAGAVVSWSVGSASELGDTGGAWTLFTNSIWAPATVTQLRVRVIGNGPSEVVVDDVDMEYVKNRPFSVTLDGGAGSVVAVLNTQLATLSVKLAGTELTWSQEYLWWGPKSEDLLEYTSRSARLKLTGGLSTQISVTAGVPEVIFTVEADNDNQAMTNIPFPHPFIVKKGHIVLPLNEGISFPVNDTSVSSISAHLYGGHGLCMAFWGVTDETSEGPAYMAIVDTPDDAVMWTMTASDGTYRYLRAGWNGEKGKFGYTRRIRFRFLSTGGHVAMAKEFRKYRKAQGLVVTLREKQMANPSVDLLIGAVNVWSWESAVPRVQALKALGIDRILWSAGGSATTIDSLNAMDSVLTSRYDIYQDAMDPANFNQTGIHGDWTWQAWPDQVVINATGDWERGWGVLGKDGVWYYCAVLCDSLALPFAKNRTELELQTKHYRGRFIDTTTASSWRECYSPDHPMTRRESKVWKMKLLELFSKDFNLVVGSETGHEAAVPYLHFFEGMMSLGPYRVADAGRNTQQVIYDVPEQITKYQLGHVYRLPLWELVYHDCVVSYWYWGDYNNKLPPVWDKRDLFNVLYGVPPMFMMNSTGFADYSTRFAQSYNNTVPIIRKIGYSEMLSHTFLTANRDVQQTSFITDEGKRMRITVNFGTSASFTFADGSATIAPMSYHVSEEEIVNSDDNGSGDDGVSVATRSIASVALLAVAATAVF